MINGISRVLRAALINFFRALDLVINLPALSGEPRHRLLAIDMFARIQTIQRTRAVPVIHRRHEDGINVLALNQPTMIAIRILGFQLGRFLSSVEMLLIKIANRTNLHIPLGEFGSGLLNVIRPLLASADDAENDPAIRADDISGWRLSIDGVLEQHRCSGDSGGNGCRFFDERPTAFIGRRKCFCIRAHRFWNSSL